MEVINKNCPGLILSQPEANNQQYIGILFALIKSMKRHLFLSVLGIMAIAIVSFNSHAKDVCRDGDTLYMPTIEMVKGDKKVLIVGFFHYGPKSYFDRASTTMKNWIAQGESPVTILTELYTCRSSVEEIKPGAQVSSDQIDLLAANINQDLAFTKRVMGETTQSQKCILDVDGVNYRPVYVVERNVRARKAFGDAGMAMQWDMVYPRGPNITARSGDIVMDHEPAASQVIGSLGYRRHQYTDADQKKADETSNRVFEWYMVDIRDEKLVSEALKELQTKDRVILLWQRLYQ